MKPHGVTLDRLMILTALAALNLSVGRVFVAWGYDDWTQFALATVFLWLAIQVALFKTLRQRGARRFFWLGFALAGLVAVFALYLALLDRRSFPGIALNFYGRLLVSYLPYVINRSPAVELTTILIFISLPQFLFALTAGYMAQAVARRFGAPHVNRPT